MGFNNPDRLSKLKKRKRFLLFEAAAKTWESPTFQSTMKIPVSGTETQCQKPSAKSPKSAFALAFIGGMTSLPGFTLEHPGLSGRKASDWLRPFPQWEVLSQADFIPVHLPRLVNDTRLEPVALWSAFPSEPEGTWSVIIHS